MQPDPDLYDNDEAMANLGRFMLDQYVNWCRRYGRPEDQRGWASYAQNELENHCQYDE